MTNFYRLHGDQESLSVFAVIDGVDYHATQSTHSNVKELAKAVVREDYDEFVNLFANPRNITTAYAKLSDRIAVRDDVIYLDNDPAPAAIAQAILQHHQQGTEQALVAFLDRLANNPNPDSVKQLYAWLQAQGVGIEDDRDFDYSEFRDGAPNQPFTIDDEGYLIAYKSVQSNGDGTYRSISSGKAIVNGAEVTGQIRQEPGDIVEMPRSEVTFDPKVGCSYGLHAGTWGYASGFSGDTILEVKIDPRDVVSVPHDSSAQKVRVSRYEVLDVITKPHSTPVRNFNGNDYSGWGESEVWEFTVSVSAAPVVSVTDLNGNSVVAGDTVRWYDTGRDYTVSSVDPDSNEIRVEDFVGVYPADKFVRQ